MVISMISWNRCFLLETWILLPHSDILIEFTMHFWQPDFDVWPGLLPWSACTAKFLAAAAIPAAVVMMNQPQTSSSKSFFCYFDTGWHFLNFIAMVIPYIAITLGREFVRVLYSAWGTLPTSRQLLWCKEAAATSTFAPSEVAREDA